ncbi:hypothetical protein D9M68_654710 [compost metagenome]
MLDLSMIDVSIILVLQSARQKIVSFRRPFCGPAAGGQRSEGGRSGRIARRSREAGPICYDSGICTLALPASSPLKRPAAWHAGRSFPPVGHHPRVPARWAAFEDFQSRYRRGSNENVVQAHFDRPGGVGCRGRRWPGHLLADIRPQCVQVQAGRACPATLSPHADDRRRDRAVAFPAHRPVGAGSVAVRAG